MVFLLKKKTIAVAILYCFVQVNIAYWSHQLRVSLDNSYHQHPTHRSFDGAFHSAITNLSQVANKHMYNEETFEW
ncbi:hypothetical protein HanXRQr2_Chr11g0497571 [Helianthus annuus]|uniref:Uncharacterized protein n=1 Tax=Helianthus annuus TaxID=4232 RepID=A0A251TB91_HELAN|nr:hypothetical protein HanXRQr2_Chr11g0497571 [Helianthus annuus]KAJ0875702.1 hypothetical protein HanPSC8_Chr11g0479611 [Helianthus annuus]